MICLICLDFFRIPTSLYKQWADYATITHQSMKSALTELLHSVLDVVIPEEKYKYPDIIVDQSSVCPRAYKDGIIKQFHLTYTPALKNEIFYIFKQTGYKNQTMEMNEEICSRLEYALKLIKHK